MNRLYCPIVLLLSCACASTTAIYDGPRRPAAEVSTIRASDFEIESIDGKAGGRFSDDFEVLPGMHLVAVRLNARRNFGKAVSRDVRRLCFIAERGRDYEIIPRVLSVKREVDGVSFHWLAEVFEQVRNKRVVVRYLNPTDTVCPPIRMAQPLQQNVPVPAESPAVVPAEEEDAAVPASEKPSEGREGPQ